MRNALFPEKNTANVFMQQSAQSLAQDASFIVRILWFRKTVVRAPGKDESNGTGLSIGQSR